MKLAAGFILFACSAMAAVAPAPKPAAAAPAPAPAPAALQTLSAAVRVAYADVSKLEPETARNTRYFYAGHVVDAKDRFELYSVFAGHVNGLSREATIVRPRRVSAWLWAIDARDYQWSLDVFGQLAFADGTVEPYLHAETLDAKGKPVRPQILAPWLPATEYAGLATATDSSTPIVRADWFIHRTAIVEGRKGHSYYDFLGLKSRPDAEKLAGLDRKQAIAIYRELAAVIPQSGVALQGRQVFRFSTVSGSWWETRDSKADKDGRAARNAERQLLDDFQHDAEEIVFTLPNRMPAYYLCDAKGNQIDSAPPDIASDHMSKSNDRRVHAGMSCARCHEAAGLKAFSDHFRRLYSAGGGLAFGSTDDVKFRRIRSAYLGPIERTFEQDVKDFGGAIKEATGLEPKAYAEAVGRQWSRYADEPVTLERLAEEVGETEERLVVALTAAAKKQPLLDPVIAGYLAKPPVPARREQVEEAWPLLMTLLEAKP